MTNHTAPDSVEERIARLESEGVSMRTEIAHLRRRRFGLGAAYVLAVIATLGLSTVGTASALAGSNTVFSDDIVDGNVKTNDLSFKTIVNPSLAPQVTGNFGAGSGGTLTGTCPAGYQPINGFWSTGNSADVFGRSHGPVYNADTKRWGWRAGVTNESNATQSVTLTVVCAKNLPYDALK